MCCSLSKELEEQRQEIQRLQGEHSKLQSIIKNLERDIIGLKKEVTERDETINEKVGFFLHLTYLGTKYSAFKELFYVCLHPDTVSPKIESEGMECLTCSFSKYTQEKRIYDLKKKNQELEKFKFVLDYKIKELKKQIEPREAEIKDMKETINAVGIQPSWVRESNLVS